jgi:DNA polymerase III subunit epsilon
MYPLANPNIIQTARQALSKNPVFLDAETTGLSQTDVVIEIGVVDLEGQTLYESLVRPSIPIPVEASAIHGISDAMVANAPSWKAVWEALYPVLHGRTIGIYNKAFDLRLLQQTHQRYWMDWTLDEHSFFCVMELYAAFYGAFSTRGGYRLHKLEAAGAACGIPLPNSHRAVDDARLTAALFKYIAQYPPRA